MFVYAKSPAFDQNQPRHPPLAQLMSLFGPFRQLATHPRPYSFFPTISCRIWRSKLKSATRRWSLPFSSRSCRSSRSSFSPKPAYFFFHK